MKRSHQLHLTENSPCSPKSLGGVCVEFGLRWGEECGGRERAVRERYAGQKCTLAMFVPILLPIWTDNKSRSPICLGLVCKYGRGINKQMTQVLTHDVGQQTEETSRAIFMSKHWALPAPQPSFLQSLPLYRSTSAHVLLFFWLYDFQIAILCLRKDN